MKRRTLLQAAIAAVVSLPFALSVRAQAWPGKAIKLVNPFPAGGGTDVFARPIAAKIGTSLGQTMFIENLGGAAGTLGAGVAASLSVVCACVTSSVMSVWPMAWLASC